MNVVRRAKRVWGVGAVLLVLSAYPLFLEAREAAMRSRSESQYAVETVDSTRVRLGTQEIAVMDAVPSCRDCAPVEAPVQTLIDGHADSSTTPVLIQPRYTDARRYRSWIRLARVTEKKNDARFVAVIQRIRPQPGTRMTGDGSSLLYRLLLVGKDGSVRSETFPFTHRDFPYYRTSLAAAASPPGMGMYPRALGAVLDPLYPVVFPWGTLLLGMILLMTASRLARRLA